LLEQKRNFGWDAVNIFAKKLIPSSLTLWRFPLLFYATFYDKRKCNLLLHSIVNKWKNGGRKILTQQTSISINAKLNKWLNRHDNYYQWVILSSSDETSECLLLSLQYEVVGNLHLMVWKTNNIEQLKQILSQEKKEQSPVKVLNSCDLCGAGRL
jgi:hypothetical protein